jgi:hypothetical protein
MMTTVRTAKRYKVRFDPFTDAPGVIDLRTGRFVRHSGDDRRVRQLRARLERTGR